MGIPTDATPKCGHDKATILPDYRMTTIGRPIARLLFHAFGFVGAATRLPIAGILAGVP